MWNITRLRKNLDKKITRSKKNNGVFGKAKDSELTTFNNTKKYRATGIYEEESKILLTELILLDNNEGRITVEELINN